MSKFLWHDGEAKPGLGGTDDTTQQFTAGDDVILDRVLLPYDIRSTAAHVRGLQRIGVLSPGDSEQLCLALEQLLVDFRQGRFLLNERFEDGHSAIEAYLTERVGELGARVHTGRSRNDQVAVATRLYMLDCLRGLAVLVRSIALSCLEQATTHARVAMPGYTHLQRAVPSSVGLWLGGFAESFVDVIEFVISVFRILDSSPLGTAAGYGVNLPLDRQGVAQDLGFARVQINPMAVQNSRGKYELMALQAASHAMQDVRRLAWDLSLFTTAEFDFIRLPDQFTTGSSIMPNKRNPDVVELLRGSSAILEGAMTEVHSVLSLPSAYHRDLQLTKAPLIRGLQACLRALPMVPGLVQGMAFNQRKMLEAISPEMFATDSAVDLASSGLPFRQAYQKTKQGLADLPQGDAAESIARRVSPGACGNLELDQIRARLEIVGSDIPQDRAAFE